MGKEDGGAFDQNVIPELTEVARNNISFSNSDLLAGGAYPAFGSTWTMGGMFAQTSGLPLKIPIDGNAMSNQDLFMPAVTSIGDILAEQGYRQSLLIGSDAEFGGRKIILSSMEIMRCWITDGRMQMGKFRRITVCGGDMKTKNCLISRRKS